MQSEMIFDVKKGREGRDEAFELLEEHKGDRVKAGREIARRRCEEKGWVCADHVRQAMDLGEETKGDTYWLGPVFNGKGWVKLGMIQTKTKWSHARGISMWTTKEVFDKNHPDGFEPRCLGRSTLNTEMWIWEVEGGLIYSAEGPNEV